jgi:hypothetical protein
LSARDRPLRSRMPVKYTGYVHCSQNLVGILLMYYNIDG